MKRIRVAAIVLLLMFVGLGLGLAQEKNAAEKKTPTAAESAKKVYAIYLNDTRSSSYILEDVVAADFNGIKCLKGQHVDLSWVSTKTVYIPIDKVSAMVEFDSLSQYKDTIEKFHKKQMENE